MVLKRSKQEKPPQGNRFYLRVISRHCVHFPPSTTYCGHSYRNTGYRDTERSHKNHEILFLYSKGCAGAGVELQRSFAYWSHLRNLYNEAIPFKSDYKMLRRLHMCPSTSQLFKTYWIKNFRRGQRRDILVMLEKLMLKGNNLTIKMPQRFADTHICICGSGKVKQRQKHKHALKIQLSLYLIKHYIIKTHMGEMRYSSTTLDLGAR
jgi:hypothetical protein